MEVLHDINHVSFIIEQACFELAQNPFHKKYVKIGIKLTTIKVESFLKN